MVETLLCKVWHFGFYVKNFQIQICIFENWNLLDDIVKSCLEHLTWSPKEEQIEKKFGECKRGRVSILAFKFCKWKLI